MRRDALRMWPAAAYERSHLTQRFLGRSRITLNEPAAIRHVLVDNVANYARSAASLRILRPIVGRGLLLAEGEEWRRQRRATAPALAPRALPVLLAHVAGVAEGFVAEAGAAAQPVDLLARLQNMTLEAAGRAMFSQAMAPFAGRMRAMLADFAADLARPHLLDLLLPAGVTTVRDRRRRRFSARWMALIEEIIAAREAAGEGAGDLFALLRAAGEDAGSLRDQVATLILAGHETTAVALFWSLALLAGAPDVQDWVAEEVAGLPRGAALAELASRAEALPRVRAVLAEALRLYPPAFTIIRRALADDEAGGVAIARDSLVMIAPWVLHRHRRLWREPERFDPGRFMPGAPAVDRFAYLPFGIGPRVCVGAQFALGEASLILARLLAAFVVTCEGAAPMPHAIITTQPAGRCLFRLSPR